jgi:hypothetical protein
VTALDSLRPPALWDCSQDKYKDWLHLNVFDHETGAIGVINASLHGSPLDRRSRVLGTTIVNMPGHGWIGNVEVTGFDEAAIGSSAIGLSRSGIALDNQQGLILASVRDSEDGFRATFSAQPVTSSIDIEEHLPLANGWISWSVVPRLRTSGAWIIDGQEFDLASASVYHDHNWGRWHWGDDFGWEWGCFLTANGASFVLARTTDRAHSKLNRLSLFVQSGAERRNFSGPSIDLRYGVELSCVSRRVPGAMAALHQDRACPRLPAQLEFSAHDGIDEIHLVFAARDALQLIAADPIAPNGFTFIHEIVGEFSYTGQIGGATISGNGLGIFEYVD